MSDVSKTNELIKEADDHQAADLTDPDGDYCRNCADAWPCVTRRLADALESATRVPVQGEPSDGATQDRIAEIACTASGHRQGGDECMADYAIADAILAEFPALSRATMPDAATETATAQMSRLNNAMRKAEAERDAALAAVERVRAAHPKNQFKAGGKAYDYCGGCYEPFEAAIWPCPTVAALDGAGSDE